MSRTCRSCGRRYGYEIGTCTLCRAVLTPEEEMPAVVLAVTQVLIPMTGHEEVPYWCALAESEDGSRRIVKLDRTVSIGEVIPVPSLEERVLPAVGVIGSGVMGKGIAELLLGSGHPVVWVGRSIDRLEGSKAKVLERLARTHDETSLAEAEQRLVRADDYSALSGCDIVIECVVEDLGVKQEVLAAIESAMRADAILTTDTSGLPVDELAPVLERPDRFAALHFFNPPVRMRLVEVAHGTATSNATIEVLAEFVAALGKKPVVVEARPGFAVNRAFIPFVNEAIRELEEGVAPAEAIDEAIRLGLNHPMGPLALADLIGLDIVHEIMENLAEHTGDDTYAPRPLLKQLISEGKLGRKTAEGFYVY